MEGFANIYREAADAIYAVREGKATPSDLLFRPLRMALKGCGLSKPASVLLHATTHGSISD
jgi:hypothetical protein